MTTTIQAIETSYAGCRFRSRLEARWAVFFDALGVEWQYEPQGYTIGPDRVPYLPDFWLPQLEMWVEVKGRMTAEEYRTLIFAASGAGLPLRGPGTSERLPPYFQRVLILGEVPPANKAWLHASLSVIGDLVVEESVVLIGKLKTSPMAVLPIGSPSPVNHFVAGADLTDEFLERTTKGQDAWFIRPFDAIGDAYRTARSARFEYGESGAAA